MMPVVRISDPAFGDLKTISTWIGTKTPGETIDWLVREKMAGLGIERDEEPDDDVATSTESPLEFKETPGLAFTKPLSAKVNGKTIRSPRWSSILIAMIAEVKGKGLDGAKLVRALNVQADAGKREDEGFRYYPELGISVQGQSAADAWREVERLANEHNIPVKVEFWWRRNSKAQHPGRTGIVRAGK